MLAFVFTDYTDQINIIMKLIRIGLLVSYCELTFKTIGSKLNSSYKLAKPKN